MDTQYLEKFNFRTYLCLDIEWSAILSGYRIPVIEWYLLMVSKLDRVIVNKILFKTLLYIKWSRLVNFPDMKWQVLLMSRCQMIVRLSKSGLSLNGPFDNQTCLVLTLFFILYSGARIRWTCHSYRW
jgi:hypothetical protein